MDLKEYIRSIPDYPKKGILFRDITTLIKNEKAFEETINQIIERSKKYEFTKIKVPKGGMLILNTLMWHAGAPNYSEISDRHLLVAHYTPDFVKLRMNLKNDLNKNVLINDKKNKGILSQLLA